MRASALQLLDDPLVRAALRQAWIDSQPGPSGGHEEGGFILRDESGTIQVSRWPQGINDEIEVPYHHGCKYDGKEIIASFHTHPNTGDIWDPQPNEYDTGAIRDDIDLRERWYLGEFVVSEILIYFIDPQGDFVAFGRTDKRLFNE